MVKLNFPSYPIKTKTEGSKLSVFDVVRKKYVVLTPEEWVRQHVIHFLNSTYKVSYALFKVEKGESYNGKNLRSDVVVYSPEGRPRLLVECKAPEVKITHATAQQAALYNFDLKAPLILLTNGLDHYFYSADFEQKKFEQLHSLPTKI